MANKKKVQKLWGLVDRETGEIAYVDVTKPKIFGILGCKSWMDACDHWIGLCDDYKLSRLEVRVVKKK